MKLVEIKIINYCHQYNSFNEPTQEKELVSCEHLEWLNKSIPTN